MQKKIFRKMRYAEKGMKLRYEEKGMKKNEVCKENRKMRCAEKDMQKHIL